MYNLVQLQYDKTNGSHRSTAPVFTDEDTPRLFGPSSLLLLLKIGSEIAYVSIQPTHCWNMLSLNQNERTLAT